MMKDGKRKSKSPKRSKESKPKRVKPSTVDESVDYERDTKSTPTTKIPITFDDATEKTDTTHEKPMKQPLQDEHPYNLEETKVAPTTVPKSKKSQRKTKEDPSSSTVVVTTSQTVQPNDSNNSIDTHSKIDEGIVEDSEDEDDDDDYLLAAAAAWAERRDENNAINVSTTTSTTIRSGLSTNSTLSLHITQLPYDANELDLRRLFAEQGCKIISIRLVYDRDERGRKTIFRGVAFVDFMDVESYDKALLLNRKSLIRGRKLNIRPTKSKQELATIVNRTREMVQEKIQKQRAIDSGNTGENITENKNKRQEVLEKKKKKNGKKTKAEKGKEKAVKAKPTQTKAMVGDSKKKKSEPVVLVDREKRKPQHKLTKKERNRRAAILFGMKRKTA